MNLLVVDGDDTDQSVFFEHRNRKYSTMAAKISAGDYNRIPLAIGWTLSDIVDLNHLLSNRRTAKGGFGMRTNQRVAPPIFDQCGRRVIQADGSKLVSLAESQASESSAAQVCRVCQNRIENRLQISRRTADDLEHLRRRGLLLQRF